MFSPLPSKRNKVTSISSKLSPSFYSALVDWEPRAGQHFHMRYRRPSLTFLPTIGEEKAKVLKFTLWFLTEASPESVSVSPLTVALL